MNNKEIEEQEKKNVESLQKYAKENRFEIPKRGDFKTKAIGYLEFGEKFEKGVVSQNFLNKLKILWDEGNILGSLGHHDCKFCIDEGNYEGRATSCSEKVLVDNKNKVKYKFPEMIFHYCIEHHYLPPKAFIQFIMRQ